MWIGRIQVKAYFLFLPHIFIFGFFLSVVAAAEEPTPLSLKEAIQIALQNNSELQSGQEDIVLRDAALQIEASQFDPSLRMNANLKQSMRESTAFAETGLTGNLFEQKDVQIGLGWKTPLRWGGTTDLTLSQIKTDASFQRTNPTYQADLAVKWTQPLLQGFGEKITQGPLVIAKRQRDISLLTLRSRVMDVVLKIVSLYWELIFQAENLVVQKNSLNLAQQLLEFNQTKVRLGLLAPIEILVAESSVASREEAVIVAEKEVRDVEDQLGNLIGLWGFSKPVSGRILAADRPVSDEIRLDPDDLLKSALASRPEIVVAEDNIKNGNLSIEIAENQLRPSLDFVGVLGPSGIGGHVSDSLDQLASRDFYRWEVGLLLGVSIGNKAATATVRKEKAGQQKLRLEKEKVISQIKLDVREGDRRVKSDFERIKATRRALDLSKQQLSSGEERFHLGLLSSHDIIEFQNDVAIAEGHSLRAIIDYNKSLANIYRVTGTLLEQYSIETGYVGAG
ncbi:MAG: TolC family protein [Nitrospirae bacterium]|nr:TolC family protein [Candidatus Troglogloeales bacterium]MBI3598374.1 TolC family protein [Candidatus Troglogloeales bacterium]